MSDEPNVATIEAGIEVCPDGKFAPIIRALDRDGMPIGLDYFGAYYNTQEEAENSLRTVLHSFHDFDVTIVPWSLVN